MKIAFYPTLKRLDDPRPSGDRTIARQTVRLLSGAGHELIVPELPTTRDPQGSPARQADIGEKGKRAADDLIARWRAAPATVPDVWLTYHLYYKAPDPVGPRVAAALGLPYAVIEPSFAARRRNGPWADNLVRCETALRQAKALFVLSRRDRPALEVLLGAPAPLHDLPPWTDAPLPARSPPPMAGPCRLVTVAMMRDGDKLASYRLMFTALNRLTHLDWTLKVLGDGPARAAVEAAAAPLGARIRFAGEGGRRAVQTALGEAEIFVWPGLHEGAGLVFLEAQAAGLPVIACDGPGPRGLVVPGISGWLAPYATPEALAATLAPVLSSPIRRRTMGRRARRHVETEHAPERALNVLEHALAAIISRSEGAAA